MTKGEFYELVHQIEVEAYEFAKDKGEFRHILEQAYALGAHCTLQKFLNNQPSSDTNKK